MIVVVPLRVVDAEINDPVFVVEAVKFVAVVVANILVPVALRLPVLVVPKFPILAKKIGRASCRERVLNLVYISVVAV